MMTYEQIKITVEFFENEKTQDCITDKDTAIITYNNLKSCYSRLNQMVYDDNNLKDRIKTLAKNLNSQWNIVESKPEQIKKELKTGYKYCSKCGGTGLFCLGYHNGKPFSNTGTTCFKCNGTGIIKN